MNSMGRLAEHTGRGQGGDKRRAVDVEGGCLPSRYVIASMSTGAECASAVSRAAVMTWTRTPRGRRMHGIVPASCLGAKGAV